MSDLPYSVTSHLSAQTRTNSCLKHRRAQLHSCKMHSVGLVYYRPRAYAPGGSSSCHTRPFRSRVGSSGAAAFIVLAFGLVGYGFFDGQAQKVQKPAD